jgi:hypothetical protein
MASPDITPNPNGTVSLEWESEIGYAMLEVGITRLSFYAKPVGGTAARLEGRIDDLPSSAPKQIGAVVGATLWPAVTSSSITQIEFAAVDA